MIADYKHTHTQKPPKSKKPTDQLKKKKVEELHSPKPHKNNNKPPKQNIWTT